jgi:hypothetical protein
MFKKIASIVLASSLVFGVVVPAAYADTAGAKYKDGTYTGEASVVPDENEEFDAYGIKVDVTVENGAVTGVCYSADTRFKRSNKTYADLALDGEDSVLGMAARIIAANGVEGVELFLRRPARPRAYWRRQVKRWRWQPQMNLRPNL